MLPVSVILILSSTILISFRSSLFPSSTERKSSLEDTTFNSSSGGSGGTPGGSYSLFNYSSPWSGSKEGRLETISKFLGGMSGLGGREGNIFDLFQWWIDSNFLSVAYHYVMRARKISCKLQSISNFLGRGGWDGRDTIFELFHSREASSRMTHDLKHLSRDQVKKSECIFVILTTMFWW